MRLRKKPWVDGELMTNGKIVHDPQRFRGNWSEYFGNDRPIHMELGCGKGQFIIETAGANPDINYIAMERQSTVIAAAVRQASDALGSLAFVNIDVKDIENIAEDDEIERLYINFCDPWPNRNKWAKRRLTHANFLSTYEKILCNNGSVFLKTDNRILFEFSINQFSERGWILRNVSLDLHNSGMDNNIMTEYERKYAAQNNPIYRLEAYIS